MIEILCPKCKTALKKDDERGLHLLKKCPNCGDTKKFTKALEEVLASRSEMIADFAKSIGKSLRAFETPDDLPMEKLIIRIATSPKYRDTMLAAITGEKAAKKKAKSNGEDKPKKKKKKKTD